MPQPQFDAIVIGSGLGGLTTSAFLAHHGQRVLILERHSVPGGFTHTFRRKGYVWDVGVHYVGQVGDKNSLMRKVFDFVSDGELQWASMGSVYDRVRVAGRTIDYVSGVDNQIAALIQHFPEEERAIRRYYELIRGFPMSSGLFFGERSMPRWLSWLVGGWMRRSFLKRARLTTYEALSELTTNRELIAVLCGQCGDYGLPPKKSSFAIHAGLVDHFVNGGSYPVGGASAISTSMLAGIQKRGGELRVNTEVAQILMSKGRAIGVRLKTGEEIWARKIVSNTGARNTFLRLCPENSIPSQIVSELQAIAPSLAHVCLYVGLNASDAELQLPKHNFWLYDSDDFDGEYVRRMSQPSHQPLLTYISFPSAKDPLWPARHPNRASVQVIAPCPYEWVQEWQDGQWRRRGEDYEGYKQKWQEVLLEKLYEVVPQVRGHVDHCEVSTPLSTRHFSNHAHGEIYGLEHTPERMGAKWLRAHTPVKNLFLTGQDIVMVGVGGALFSGVITAVAMLGPRAIWPLVRQQFRKSH